MTLGANRTSIVTTVCLRRRLCIMSYVYDLITQRTDWLEHLIEEHKISVSKDDEADPLTGEPQI